MRRFLARCGVAVALLCGGLLWASPFADNQNEFLPVEQAFVVGHHWINRNELAIVWQMPQGYYLYRDQLKFNEPGFFGKPVIPDGKRKTDDYFGEVEVYYDQLQVKLPLLDFAPDKLDLTLGWQGCADAGLCYPPQERALQLTRPTAAVAATAATDVAVADAADIGGGVRVAGAAGGANVVEAADVAEVTDVADAADAADAEGDADTESDAGAVGAETAAADDADATDATGTDADSGSALAEDQRLAAQLASAGLLWNLLAFYVLGLLLAFTPCVLPMVPILSSLLVGAGDISRARSVALSGVYVLAMALTYAAAGVAAALTGANLQAALQDPWVLGVFAALLVALALSMFGLYEIQVPARLQGWLSGKSNQQQGGNLAGAALMGLLSALIVGPCVAPPLVGALIYISQSGDALVGGGALLAMGLGMGTPLILVGGALGDILPRAGAWMEHIKWLFGFVLLGLGIWFVERVLPGGVAALLWGGLLCMAAVWLVGVVPAEGNALLRMLARAAGLAAALWALLFFAGASGLSTSVQQQHANDGFADVYSLAEVEQVIARQDKPILLDFYADWCVECKQMEAEVFPAPEVQDALKGWVALRADVTANDAQAQELMRHYSVLGPPTLIFLQPDGRELRQLRVVGEIDAAGLAERLRSR